MDRRWRTLERAAAAGDVEAEARLLRERVRAHDLAPEGLELASFLGHPGARWVTGDGPRVERVSPRRWLTALSRFGPQAVCLAAVSAALFVLPIWETSRPGDQRARRALLQVQRAPLSSEDRVLARWSLETCVPGRGPARDALSAAHHAANPDAPAVRARWAFRCAALARAHSTPCPDPKTWIRPKRWTPRHRTWRPGKPEREPTPEALSQVQRAATRALVPWALCSTPEQEARTGRSAGA